MEITCRLSGKKFTPREKDLAFYERMGVPVPDLCPEEMLRGLMALRNEWKLYRRKCDKTGETIISAYDEDTPFPVYKNEIWWGDSWSGLDFGRNFDFEKGFFEQFLDLRNQVPREGTSVFNCENCDYNGHIRESRNCYLCALVAKVEDCMYSYWIVNDKDIIDCRMANDSELCYECVNVKNCFECIMCQECSNCTECAFSYQLQGCDHCIGCSNLYRKSYYVFNKKVTPEQYEEAKKKILNGSYRTWQQGMHYFKDLWMNTPHRYTHNLNCENTEGDSCISSKNCFQSFEAVDCEDCGYNVSASGSKDTYHTHSAGWPGCELIYSCGVVRGSTDLAFSYYCWFSNNLRYCDSCISCQDCFGCVGLKHKKYCILNKQYSKEEYEILRDKIIQHMEKEGSWGQMPPALSTFAFNETPAQDYFPLTRDEALARGYRWKEEKDLAHDDNQDLELWADIPDSVFDVQESDLKAPIRCAKTGKLFKIQKKEFELYKKMGLPIPRLCPDVRRAERAWRVNPYHLHERKCDMTGKDILSSYAPDRPEKICSDEWFLENRE